MSDDALADPSRALTLANEFLSMHSPGGAPMPEPGVAYSIIAGICAEFNRAMKAALAGATYEQLERATEMLGALAVAAAKRESP